MNWLIYIPTHTYLTNTHSMAMKCSTLSSLNHPNQLVASLKTSVFRYEIDFYVQPTNYRALSANSTCKHTSHTLYSIADTS